MKSSGKKGGLWLDMPSFSLNLSLPTTARNDFSHPSMINVNEKVGNVEENAPDNLVECNVAADCSFNFVNTLKEENSYLKKQVANLGCLYSEKELVIERLMEELQGIEKQNSIEKCKAEECLANVLNEINVLKLTVMDLEAENQKLLYRLNDLSDLDETKLKNRIDDLASKCESLCEMKTMERVEHASREDKYRVEIGQLNETIKCLHVENEELRNRVNAITTPLPTQYFSNPNTIAQIDCIENFHITLNEKEMLEKQISDDEKLIIEQKEMIVQLNKKSVDLLETLGMYEAIEEEVEGMSNDTAAEDGNKDEKIDRNSMVRGIKTRTFKEDRKWKKLSLGTTSNNPIDYSNGGGNEVYDNILIEDGNFPNFKLDTKFCGVGKTGGHIRAIIQQRFEEGGYM